VACVNPRRLVVAALLATACGAAPSPPAPPPVPVNAVAPVAVAQAPEEPPRLQLPSQTRPSHESLLLTIDPAQERFSGVAEILVTLEKPRSVLWLHGQGLHVTRATVAAQGKPALPATWQEVGPKGTASLTVAQPIPAGGATLHIEYDAPFGHTGEGLFKVTEGAHAYAFTQFENISARQAFPCFDEPGFKVSWHVALITPPGVQAVANTSAVLRRTAGYLWRNDFLEGPPLPTYLVAFAVGPLDFAYAHDVRANGLRHRRLGLRGIATEGHGEQLGYTLAHAGEIVTTLEQYFGIPYPFEKLDLIAVPGMIGAMENAAAVTFDARYILLGDGSTATVRQKRDWATFVTHELAHQWVGDLVTAEWWDDIWLNEAFATWLEAKIADAWSPATGATTELVSAIQRAMASDSLASARAVRQPIGSVDDIDNAFDNITYDKGGGLLRMFEHWVGPSRFQKGLHDYLMAHSFDTATADDFLDAVSKAAEKDVKTPFHTFLDQPGVPYVEARVQCDGTPRLHLTQTRYLPTGSTGDAGHGWQIPVCARYGVGKETHEACTLLTEHDGDLPLGATCPAWVMPNEDALGYYRFSLAPTDLEHLRTRGLAALGPLERMALVDSLHAGLERGTLSVKDALDGSVALARDPHPRVAGEAMGFLSQARDWLYRDPARGALEAYARDVFGDAYKDLGWSPGKDEDSDRSELRARVIGFLATTGQDLAVQALAKQYGRASLRTGLATATGDLETVKLEVLGQDADRPLFDQLARDLAGATDPGVRVKLLSAVSAIRSHELAARVRELTLTDTLRTSELLTPLFAQMAHPETRDATWDWVKQHWDLLAGRVASESKSDLLALAGSFCDEAHAADLSAFATPARMAGVDGGPRVLATTLESVHLCALRRRTEEPILRALFRREHAAPAPTHAAP